MQIAIERGPLTVLADVLVDVGRAIVMGRIKGGQAAGAPGAAEPNQVAWGTGTTVAARTQTALAAEAAEARVTATTSLVASGNSGTQNDTYRISATLTNNQGTVSKSITEAGAFDTAKAAGGTPGGNMFIRGDFGVITVALNDSLVQQWDWRLT